MVAISRARSSIFVKTESLSMLGLQKKNRVRRSKNIKGTSSETHWHHLLFFSIFGIFLVFASLVVCWSPTKPVSKCGFPFQSPKKQKKTICSFPSSIWREGSSSTPMAEDPQNLRALWPLRPFRPSGLANLRGHWTDPQSRRSARGWGIRGALGLQVSWISWIFMGRTWFQHLRVCQHTSFDGTWPEKCGILSFGNLTWQWKINVCRWFSH